MTSRLLQSRDSRLKLDDPDLLQKLVKDPPNGSKLSTKAQGIAQIHSRAALITMETTATTTASSMARASPPGTPSKSSQFKSTVWGEAAQVTA